MEKDKENCTVGTWPAELPEELINEDIVTFENCPLDAKSKYICDLLMLHLWRFNEEQKDEIIAVLMEILDIKPLKSEIPNRAEEMGFEYFG